MPDPWLMSNDQYCVYWPVAGVDLNGMPKVATVAQELQALWEDEHREARRPDGRTLAVDATVMGLSFEPRVGAAFAKGRINDLLGAGQTGTIDVMRVVHTSTVPDISGRGTEFVAYLQRSKDAMPGQDA